MREMIDDVDSRIICLLQEDGRISYTKIASELGISVITVRTRVQRLLEEGVMRFVVVCDPRKLGFAVAGTMRIKIDLHKLDNVLTELKGIREIWNISLMTGRTDISVDFILKTFDDMRVLIYDKVNKIEGVIETETSLIMSNEKNNYRWGTAIDED